MRATSHHRGAGPERARSRLNFPLLARARRPIGNSKRIDAGEKRESAAEWGKERGKRREEEAGRWCAMIIVVAGDGRAGGEVGGAGRRGG
jgi:hypothetical protein